MNWQMACVSNGQNTIKMKEEIEAEVKNSVGNVQMKAWYKIPNRSHRG